MSAAGRLGVRTFASLQRHRNYRLYFAGQVVSVTGTWVQNVAQAWLVVELTRPNSALAVGVLALCQFSPFALGGLVGGVVADRVDNRRLLMGTQSAAMLLAVILAALALTHVATVWMVDVVAAAYGTVLIFDTPARQAFTMQLVGRDELPNAVALNSSLFSAARVVGPGLGGLLIAATGVGICFAINALSYVAVLACLLAMRVDELHHPRRERRPSLVRGLGEGLGYAWHAPQVRMVLVMMLGIGTIAINFNVLLPVLASATLGAGALTFGTLSASFGAGALVGALAGASLGRASWPVLLAGAGGLGVGELALAPLHAVWACAVVLALTGVAFTLYTSNSNSTIQLSAPDRLRGRVLSLYAYVFFGTAPLGGLLAGWLCARGGTLLALVVGGGVAVAMTLYGLVWRHHGWGTPELRRGTGEPRRAPGKLASAGR